MLKGVISLIVVIFCYHLWSQIMLMGALRDRALSPQDLQHYI